MASILIVGVGFLGAGTLKDLALALFIGTAAGTYSSIFIATPVACQLQERRPEMKALTARVAARRAGSEAKSTKSAKQTASSTGASTATATLVATETDPEARSVAEQAKASYVVSSGTRQQPKKNTTRSQRKKR